MTPEPAAAGLRPRVLAEEVELVVFDLDGTLTDSRPGISAAYRHTLREMRLPPVPPEAIDRCIGPPIRETLKSIGVPAARLEEAVGTYRAWFNVHGIFDNSVYEGVADLLSRLRAARVPMAVATAKVEANAVTILRHFQLDPFVGAVCGATPDDRLVEKTDILAETLARAGVVGSERVVMVGDRAQDMEGARANGVVPVGAGWGYGVPGELEAAGARYVLTHPLDLAELLGA